MNNFGVAQLIIYDQRRVISKLIINKQQLSIGRYKAQYTCDIPLHSELVSSIHGAFNYYAGEYYYTDYVNLNGTFINGKIIPKEPGKVSVAQKLRDGDVLTIGATNISRDKTVYIYFTTSIGANFECTSLPLAIGGKTFKLGRDYMSSDIVIDDVVVSRRHAVITIDVNGKTFIKDLRSQNGTILNGVIIKPNIDYPFRERDKVYIGSSQFIHFGSAIVFCNPKRVKKVKDEHSSPIKEKKVVSEIVQDINNIPPKKSPEGEKSTNDENSKCGGVELRIEQLTKTVACKNGTGINGGDKKNILENVSFTIYPGELVAILGGSGAGKTTLMNAINGFEPATNGSVYLNGTDLYKNYQSFKALIGYVPQQDIVYDNLTVNDMLAYVAKLRLPGDLSKQEIDHRVDDVLKSIDLVKQKHTLIKKLSGGQRKRASIAVELISDPMLFFLDEPTSGLDPEAETNLMKQLQNLSSSNGKTIIVITHTLQNIHLFDKVIFMAPGGKLCYYGSPEDAKSFFEVDNLSDAYEKISNDIDGYVRKFNLSR